MAYQIGKPTIHTLVKCILTRAVVPTDEEILAEIHMVRPDSILTGPHLRWYKHRFRRGALPGMDGTCHSYNQPRIHDPALVYGSEAREKRVRCVVGCGKCPPQKIRLSERPRRATGRPGHSIHNEEIMAAW